MKRILLVLFALILCLCCTGCIQSLYTDADGMKADFESHRELYRSAAEEALGYGDSTFISTYEYYRPDGEDASLSGLYVYDTEKKTCTPLSSETIQTLMDECDVHSLGVKAEEGTRICEFSIGAGRQFYNGIYFADPDRELFLSNFAVPLTADGEGWSYSVDDMHYYTEKWDDGFYYFVAKTR